VSCSRSRSSCCGCCWILALSLFPRWQLLDFLYAAHGLASVSCGRSGLGSRVWIPPSVHRVPRFLLAASSPAVIFTQIFCSFFQLFSSAGRSAVPVSVWHLSSSFAGSSPDRGCHSALVICSLITLCVVLDFLVLITLTWWFVKHARKVFGEMPMMT
jgi:hypothetical protein